MIKNIIRNLKVNEAQVLLLVGRPLSGKTANAIDAALEICIRQRKKVVFYSLEISAERLRNRAKTCMSSFESRSETIDEDGSVLESCIHSYEKEFTENLIIKGPAKINIDEIYAECLTLKAANNLDFLVIDYVQLIHNRNSKKNIVPTLEFFRKLSIKLKISILILSQMQRNFSEDGFPTIIYFPETKNIFHYCTKYFYLHKLLNADKIYNIEMFKIQRVNNVIEKVFCYSYNMAINILTPKIIYMNRNVYLDFGLFEALNEIEHIGSEFNKLSEKQIAEQLFDYDEYLPAKAFEPIKKYVVDTQIKVGKYNWDAFFKSYEDEEDDTNAILFRNALEDLRADAVSSCPSYNNMPLPLVLLFKTLSVVFHLDTFKTQQKILYIDMDNVIVDFASAFAHYDKAFLDTQLHKDNIVGIFNKMKPVEGAIQCIENLYRYFDIYILSTAPYKNPSAWKDKIDWIKKYLPVVGYKRLILSHHKNLNVGDYLIDDRFANGVLGFKGQHIHFKEPVKQSWLEVEKYLMETEVYPLVKQKLIQQKINTCVVFFAGYGGGKESNSYNTLKDNLENCNFEIIEYDNLIATKALHDINIKLKLLMRNSETVILVGNSLGGYYANYFAEKYNLQCVLINPSLQPKTAMAKYGLANKYLKLFVASTFLNKNKYVFLGKNDDIVEPTFAAEMLADTIEIFWLEEGHRIKDFSNIIDLINKII